MASINKLSIRGIRAFSPEDQEQVIEFFYPVTVIVGANGCGKTTIIESLKYAVTGSLPPGNKPGQAFVHDPKSIGLTVVKGNIKLRFTNRASKTMVVNRSVELKQNKTTLTFKALDGVLRTQDPSTGERISMSHKCSELDRQIPTLMGVSKPILEHVVFCHQEDSSWPLSESSALKKRFDDIFDSTRYAKALDAIRSTAKEYTGHVKELKVELAGLKSHKHAAKQFEKELEENSDRLEELETKISSCKEELQSTMKEKSKLQEIMNQIEEAKDEKELKDNELEKEIALERQQRQMLYENLVDDGKTIEELHDMIADYDDKTEEKIAEKEQKEKQVLAIRHKIEKCRKDEMNLRNSIGKLEAEKEQHDNLLKKRMVQMENIATNYGINLLLTQTQQMGGTNAGGTSFTQDTHTTIGNTQGTTATTTSVLTIAKEDMDAFLRALAEKENELNTELSNKRKEAQSSEDKLQKALSELMGKKASVENDNDRIQRERQKIRSEMDSLAQSIGGSSGFGSRVRKSEVDEAKRTAAKAHKDRESASKDTRRADIPKELRRNEELIDKLKREIDDDNYVRDELRKFAEGQNEIAVLKEQIVKDVEILQESIRDESYPFRKYNLPSPATMAGISNDDDNDDYTNGEELGDEINKVVDTLDEKYNTMKDDVKRGTEEQQKIQQAVSEKTALYTHNKQSLDGIEGKIQHLDKSVQKYHKIINSICEFDDDEGIETPSNINNNVAPQDLVKYLEDAIEDYAQDDLMKPEVVKKLMKKLAKMSKQNVATAGHLECPCCKRGLKDDEVQVFQDTLREFQDEELSPFLNQDSRKKERNQQAVQNYKKWKASVSKIMNDITEYERIKREGKELDETVTQMREELHTQKEELSNIKDKNADMEKEMSELQEFVQKAKRWSEDASRIHEKRIQVNQKQQLDQSMSMSAVDHGNRDLKTVERELSERMEQKDSLMSKNGRLTKELSNLTTSIGTLTEKANKCDQVAKDLEARYEREQAASIRRNELTESLSKLDEQERKNRDDIAPLSQKIESREREKRRMRAAASNDETRITNSLHQFREDVNKLKDLTSSIDGYTDSNKIDDLERLNSDIAGLNENASKHEEELQILEPELESLKKAVSDQESYKKNINDNIAVLKKQKEIEKLQVEVDKIEEQIESIEGSGTCGRDVRVADKRIRELSEVKAKHEGRRGGFVDQIRALKRKLKTEEYKDIDERYRQMNIRYETTDLAVKDLDKYYSALDRALMRYHSIKIEEINKIIRELWTLTYKGQDITNIELESGNDGGSRAKRSYSYRVVMTKGTTKLDMRGRCSAGQRVLACIVIRLALAETFCLNCGVIALDEPTVNLDFENKKGLAVSLAQIIALRAKQNNFQLIVITHDEDFVSMMKRELVTHTGFDMPDRYFQVSREEASDGKMYSKINAIDWDEIGI